MSQKIEKINTEFENDGVEKRQDFILFKARELEVMREAVRLSGLSKSRAIAVGCKLLMQEIAKNKAEKSDGEEN